MKLMNGWQAAAMIAAAFVAFSVAAVSAESGDASLIVGKAVDAARALALAKYYLGYQPAPDSVDECQVVVEKTRCADSLVLEVARENIQTCWAITFREFAFRQPRNDWADHSRYVRDIRVLLDSATGTLVEIRVLPQDTGKIYPPEISVDEESARLRVQGEEYMGYPSSPPDISLLRAINRADASIGHARKVTARYVMWRNSNPNPHDSTETPAWVVHYYGLNPRGWHHGQVRTVYAAGDASILASGSSPEVTFDDLRENGWTRKGLCKFIGEWISEAEWNTPSPYK